MRPHDLIEPPPKDQFTVPDDMLQQERVVAMLSLMLRRPSAFISRGTAENDLGPRFGYRPGENNTRTWNRDLDRLASFGIPLERWDDGRVRIRPDAWARHRLELTRDERRMLAAAAAFIADGSEEDQIRRAALEGVLKALGPDFEPLSPTVTVSARMQVGLRDRPKAAQMLHKFTTLLNERRQARLTYADAQGHGSVRVVEPYGVAERIGGAWYLVGKDVADGVVKTFNVHRVASVAKANRDAKLPQYEIDAAFDIDEVVPPVWMIGDGEVQAATVSVAPDHVASFRRGMSPSSEAAPDSGGWIEFTLDYRNEDNLVRLLMMRGDGVRIISPPSAVERIKQYLREV